MSWIKVLSVLIENMKKIVEIIVVVELMVIKKTHKTRNIG